MSKATEVLDISALEQDFSYTCRSSFAHASVYVAMEILKYTEDECVWYTNHLTYMNHAVAEVRSIHKRLRQHFVHARNDDAVVPYMNITSV